MKTQIPVDQSLEEVIGKLREGDSDLQMKLKEVIGTKALATLLSLQNPTTDPAAIRELLVNKAESLKGSEDPLDVDQDFWYIVLAIASTGLAIDLSEHPDLELPPGYSEVRELVVSMPDNASLVVLLKQITAVIKRARAPKSNKTVSLNTSKVPDEFPST